MGADLKLKESSKKQNPEIVPGRGAEKKYLCESGRGYRPRGVERGSGTHPPKRKVCTNRE